MDPITTGLALASGTAIMASIAQLLRSWVSVATRKEAATITIRYEKEDGTIIEITSESIDEAKIGTILKAVAVDSEQELTSHNPGDASSGGK